MFAQRFRWLSALPLFAVILALAAIALGTLSGAHAPSATSREALFDYFQRLQPAPAETASPFHVVSIDRESLAAVGPWPWPRSVLADLVEAAGAAGALGVVVSEPVDAPDPLSPQVIGDFWLQGARDEELARQLDLLPSTDAALAAALERTGGAAGVAPDAKTVTRFERADTAGLDWLDLAGGGGEFLAMPAARLQFPVAQALAGKTRLAVAALPADADGGVRRAPLFWSVNGAAAPSIALEAARLAAGGAGVAAQAHPSAVSAAGPAVKSVAIGDGRRLPLGEAGDLRFYSPKRPDVARTSAAKILSGDQSNSQLRDRVVLIGLDREIGESVRLARGEFAPAEAHALFASQILDGVALKRPDWIGFVEAAMVMLLGAAAIIWAQSFDFWKALGLAALTAAALVGASFTTFAFSSTLLNPLPGALALVIGAFSVAGGRSLGVVLRDDQVRGTFQGSLPEPAMKKIREESAAEILDGRRRPVTVLSCELRLLDEDLEKLSAHPDDVTRMMAAACNSLRNTIIETGGAADQAEGGKIFAYFNAPLEAADHIDAACSAALRLVESMDKTNAELEASTRTRGVQIHLAIGVATGECFVGPMGHGRHNRYSAIGPAVDMAAFLRKQAEFYGPAIICDEPVYRTTHHHFAYLELDRLRTNKSATPISIYALVGNPFIKSSKGYRHLDEIHRELLTAYRAGDLEAARTKLSEVKQSPGAAIALFDIYEKRIAELAEKGLPPGWDGAHPVTL